MPTEQKLLPSPKSKNALIARSPLWLKVRRNAASITVGALVGVTSFLGLANYKSGHDFQDMLRVRETNMQQVIKQETQKIKASQLMDQLEEIRWEQLEEAWREISEHATVEEEMKIWLETQFNELQASSEACTSDQKARLSYYQQNARSAIDKVTKGEPTAIAKDERKELLFKQAHLSIQKWNAALLEICS